MSGPFRDGRYHYCRYCKPVRELSSFYVNPDGQVVCAVHHRPEPQPAQQSKSKPKEVQP